MRALEDGYGQAEIARYLGISAALVSHVFRSINGVISGLSKTKTGFRLNLI